MTAIAEIETAAEAGGYKVTHATMDRSTVIRSRALTARVHFDSAGRLVSAAYTTSDDPVVRTLPASGLKLRLLNLLSRTPMDPAIRIERTGSHYRVDVNGTPALYLTRAELEALHVAAGRELGV